jgi:hypothetical protein
MQKLLLSLIKRFDYENFLKIIPNCYTWSRIRRVCLQNRAQIFCLKLIFFLFLQRAEADDSSLFFFLFFAYSFTEIGSPPSLLFYLVAHVGLLFVCLFLQQLFTVAFLCLSIAPITFYLPQA